MFSNKKESNQTHERTQESSLFGKGCTFRGSIEATENVRVDGNVIGKITTQAKIVAGEESLIEGNIHAERAEISGEVRGDIVVTDILILRKSARIHGDIFTDKLIMDEGASFNGKCKVGEKVKQMRVEKDDNARPVNGNNKEPKQEYISVAG